MTKANGRETRRGRLLNSKSCWLVWLTAFVVIRRERAWPNTIRKIFQKDITGLAQWCEEVRSRLLLSRNIHPHTHPQKKYSVGIVYSLMQCSYNIAHFRHRKRKRFLQIPAQCILKCVEGLKTPGTIPCCNRTDILPYQVIIDTGNSLFIRITAGQRSVRGILGI